MKSNACFQSMPKETLFSKLLSSEALSHEKLCFLFERRGLDWVADELKAELLWERGKLPVETYIREEATVLVAGIIPEGQLSEPLKEKLIDAIAAKVQVCFISSEVKFQSV